MQPRATGKQRLAQRAQEFRTCDAAAKFLALAERHRQILATHFHHLLEIRWRLLFLDSLLLVDAPAQREDLAEIHVGAVPRAVPAVPRERRREDLRQAAHPHRDHLTPLRRGPLVGGRTKQSIIF